MAEEKTTPNTPNAAYKEMEKSWELPDALMGGTRAMQEKEQTFLPKEPRENAKEYDARLRRTFLFNGFRRTTRVLSSKPFATPPTVSDSLPNEIQEVFDDPDLTGRGMSNLGRDLMIDLLARGKAHVLVDHPTIETPLTLAQERANGIRPYFVHIPPRSLHAWRGATDQGAEELEQIRYRITTVEPEGDWGEKEVHRVVVWFQDRVEVYIEQEDSRGEKKWILEDDPSANTLGYIPLITVYANQTGFLTAETPLEDLAYLNLEHWQSKSDQKNILHVARVPLLHFKGFDKGAVEKAAVGPFNAFVGGKDSEIVYVEHQGAAIDAGAKDLEKLENQMRVMGADLLVEKPGNETATAKAIDSAEKVSDLQAIVMNLEQGLMEMLHVAAEWRQVELDPNLRVNLNQSFGLSMRDAAVKEFLIQARMAGEISRKTFLEEAKRYGFLMEEIDVDDELERIEDEAPGRPGNVSGDLDEFDRD